MNLEEFVEKMGDTPCSSCGKTMAEHCPICLACDVERHVCQRPG